MFSISQYRLEDNPSGVKYVICLETVYCSYCSGETKYLGRRERGYIKDTGEHEKLLIPRNRCEPCKKIHHVLPDFLVPYKRYDRESIEGVLNGNDLLTVAADESTIRRWRKWFRIFVDYFIGCIISVMMLLTQEVPAKPQHSLSPLKKLQHYVGSSPGWLSKVVRLVVNGNYWVCTRSAFLSG